MRHLGIAASAAIIALFAAGCGDSNKPADTNGQTGSTNSAKALKIGVVFDRGGLGDKSFNDSAWRGIQRAAEEFGFEPAKVETKHEKDYETNLTAMADQGMDLVIAIGINQTKALEKVAPEYPDIKFAIVDGMVEANNVRSLKFTEHEGSFLVGYLAGLMSKTGKLGFVGGQELDLVTQLQSACEEGARTAHRSTRALPAKHTWRIGSIDQAKAAANILFDGGADIVYHAAGRGGLGVIRAAKERNLYAIGVDSDQDGEAEGNVLTSMIKRVDEAVYSTIKDVKEGNFSSGVREYNLAENGVGISDLKFTKDLIGPDNLAKLEEVKGRIIAGEIKVPQTKAEFETYMASVKK